VRGWHLVKVVGCLDQPRRNCRRVREAAVDFKGGREVGNATSFRVLPPSRRRHVIEHVGRIGRRRRRGAWPFGVQLGQSQRHRRIRLVLTRTPVGSKGGEADGHVLGVALGKNRPEALSAGNEHCLPSCDLEFEPVTVKQHHPSLEHAHPLVVVEREPRLRGRVAHLDKSDRDAVRLGSDIARELIDGEALEVDDSLGPADDVRHDVVASV